jgi:mannose-1-phosphate guanylyltransferase/mannose-6-phosphate isomerase
MIQSIKINTQPVILCGGTGTRLWPLSRIGFPKQFLCLTGNESLFQQAARRLAALDNEHITVSAPLIVSGEDHRFLASEQLREVGIAIGAALLEPVGRNTAPALTLAALAATQDGQDPVLVVTPADQTVANNAAFTAALQHAIKAAADGTIVTLGVTPTGPETGYGYIQAVPLRSVSDSASESLRSAVEAILTVLRFAEKPRLEVAQQYLQEGGYFWNAGIFVLKASVWLNALDQFRPDILQATKTAWVSKTHDGNFVRPGKAEFAAIPAESVDYAVIEHCPSSKFLIKMVPIDVGWSDLGAWDAVWSLRSKDAQGNAHFGDVLTFNSSNTLVHATSRLVTLVGVQDLVVVETPDAVLVVNQKSSQDVKHIVKQLIEQKREEHTQPRKVHRPWGWYDSIEEDGRFKIKRIHVKPKASISLQKHHHRAEHWIVVAGTAEITIDSQVFTLTDDQSTYIPLGVVHRLANPGSIPLEIIEVQTGSYLCEDDITRIEDTYGRL